jgi:hypothetical protein
MKLKIQRCFIYCMFFLLFLPRMSLAAEEAFPSLLGEKDIKSFVDEIQLSVSRVQIFISNIKT